MTRPLFVPFPPQGLESRWRMRRTIVALRAIVVLQSLLNLTFIALLYFR
jgi:hypothetical protein